MNKFENQPKNRSEDSAEFKKEKIMEEYMGQMKFRHDNKTGLVFEWESKETETRRNDILILKILDKDIVGLLMSYDKDISRFTMLRWFSQEIIPHSKKSYIFDVYRYIIDKDEIKNLLDRARGHIDPKTEFIADAYNYIAKNQ